MGDIPVEEEEVDFIKKKCVVLAVRITVFMFLAACASIPSAPTQAPLDTSTVHWRYEGEEGPEHWGELSSEFSLCSSGQRQSPIDIAQSSPQDVANIAFHYRPTKVNILNNGHTIQVNYDPGSYIEVDGLHYELVQFHFHAPSEHRINGNLAEAELHLVHSSQEGNLAVVAVLLEKGSENIAFGPVRNNLPAEENALQMLNEEINAADLLPLTPTTYRYEGSLTTPPCTEGVQWFVMTKAVELSDDQVAAFTRIFEGNNRPVQTLNQREVIQDTSE